MQQRQTNKGVRRNRTEEILEKATGLFAEYGFQGTTLAMVAEDVGLTEPGVLHYFPSKVHLLQGVLEYRDRKDFEKYSVLIESKKESFAELFGIVEHVWAENEKVPGLVQLFIVLVGESIGSEHPSHDFFVDRYHRRREIYTRQLSKIEAPVEVDPDELASLIMAVMDGLQIQWLLDPEKVDLAATFKLFSEIVVGYMERSER